LILTTTPEFTAEFLLEKQPIWEKLIAFNKAQINQSWHKVVIHGVPTQDFNNLNIIINEIKTFNKGLNPIRSPY
jgi:hypothetical protein